MWLKILVQHDSHLFMACHCLDSKVFEGYCCNHSVTVLQSMTVSKRQFSASLLALWLFCPHHSIPKPHLCMPLIDCCSQPWTGLRNWIISKITQPAFRRMFLFPSPSKVHPCINSCLRTTWEVVCYSPGRGVNSWRDEAWEYLFLVLTHNSSSCETEAVSHTASH